MTITQLCEKVNVDCAKLNSIVTARRGIYFFILGDKLHAKKLLRIEVIYITMLVIGYDYRKDVAACRN